MDVLRTDPEIEMYRDLIEQPDVYEDGFNVKAIIGAVFVGFVMMPGSIYLALVVGQELGPAAEWTTIILFNEIARRSFVQMKKQEIYILFYIAGGLSHVGVFMGPIFNQYLVQSEAARGFGVAPMMPQWVTPQPNTAGIQDRSMLALSPRTLFFHPDWFYAMWVLMVGQVLSRMNWFGAGYTLFRITSDVEKLPFPFAPITAQGTMALAEASSKTETWRWRTFSVGSMIGLVYGFFYIGIPALTTAVMAKPLQLIPIPFVDLTRTTESFLPATPTGIATDLGGVIHGFIVPFWAVVGQSIMAASTLLLNPFLHNHGLPLPGGDVRLTTWRPGMETIQTEFANRVDFYLSLSIGVSFAVAIIGIHTVVAGLRRARRDAQLMRRAGPSSFAPPRGRGDFPLWVALGLFVVSTLGYIMLCRHLVPHFPIWWAFLFGFVVTPFQSYIDARMIGLTGQWIGIPMVREAAIFASGYKGVDIWFAPLPHFDHGRRAFQFRILELTGNKITSLIKAELIMLPIVTICSLIFWQFLWRLSPIPSAQYFYAQKMWPRMALERSIWVSSTSGRSRLFWQAIRYNVMAGGLGFGLATYYLLNTFRLPILLIYGIVRGLGILPHWTILNLIGALISRYYFEKRFPRKRWKQYATVLSAGYACGTGLVGMGSVATVMIQKSVSAKPF
ncbi:MAG: peptide transporter [Armatimonadota bacterium]